jgi:hypothetical protein
MTYKRLYSDSVIEVSLLMDNMNEEVEAIAIKYLNPGDYKDKNGNTVMITNAMGGETDWFILPFTFGAVVGKKLFEQFNAGLIGFEDEGINLLLKWLIEMEIIDDAMCY